MHRDIALPFVHSARSFLALLLANSQYLLTFALHRHDMQFGDRRQQLHDTRNISHRRHLDNQALAMADQLVVPFHHIWLTFRQVIYTAAITCPAGRVKIDR